MHGETIKYDKAVLKQMALLSLQ